MIKDKALKLALDLAIMHHSDDGYAELRSKVRQLAKEALALTSTPCEVQPEQEPVAWIHNFIEGGISIGKRPSDLNRHPERWTALYRESKPCPTCEALARTVMLDQTSHDTKRPWAGLTNNEIEDCMEMSIQKTCRAIEAKLKEKNT